MKRSLFLTVLILAALALNIISTRVFVRFDFTEGQIYTLSKPTKELMRSLENDIKVKVFVSEKLPPQAELIKQQIKDYLDEYSSLAKGKLTVSYIDPANDEEAVKLAQALGIPELQLQTIEKDQRQTIKAYLGLAVLKEKEAAAEDTSPLATVDKSETMPVVDNVADFEYDFTSAVKKVNGGEEKTIGFLAGHEEHSLAPDKSDMMGGSDPRANYDYQKVLAKNYQIKTVELSAEDAVISDVDTLIIAGPKTNLAESEMTAVADFLKKGGNVILLLDKIDVTNTLQAQNMELNLSALLANYGLEVQPKLVADNLRSTAQFSQGMMAYLLPYAFWPDVQNVNKQNQITSGIGSFTLPWSSPITVIAKEGVKVDVLATTSDHYALVDAGASLNPSTQPGIDKEAKEKLPLAVVAQKEGEGKLFVVGDSDFPSMGFTRLFAGNSVLFLNVIDAFTLGDELIAIRSKGVTDRPINPDVLGSEVVKNIIKWGNIILLPLLFIIYGLIRRSMRRARRRYSV